MRQVLTLRELGDRFGVDIHQIKRLVRVGSLPEATKEVSPSGKRWVVPADKVEEIAERHGWPQTVIDLKSDGEPAVSRNQTPTAQPAATHLSTTSVAPVEVVVASTSAVAKEAGVTNDGSVTNDGGVATARRVFTVDEAIELRDPGELADRDERHDSGGPNAGLTPIRPATPLQPPLPPDSLKIHRQNQQPTLADVLNEDLLTRLLGAHEDKATAQARVRETERALTSLTASHRHVSMQLSEERKEREILAERLREERSARLVADAKLVEVNQRVAREMAISGSEQQARHVAADRTIRAEREAAAALESLGPISRHRYNRRARKRDLA